MVPDIALAASAREWPDRLHRFILDHGGGRVVDRVLSPEQARPGIHVLLIDDVCSFLSPRMVSSLKQRGTEVIGVFDPDDGADAKRRLLECGISDVIESEASPEEFLQKIDQTLAHRLVPAESIPSTGDSFRIGVTGPCDGVGMTEVALALSMSLAGSVRAALVDMDPVWPSVAQRLGLPLHPNLRTVLDHSLHDPGRIESALHQPGDIVVVGGRVDGSVASPIGRHDASVVLDAVAPFGDVTVVDLGSLHHADMSVLREVDTVVVVGQATPVGVTRLIKATSRILSSEPDGSVLTVVNMVPRKAFHQGEVVAEIDRVLPGTPVFTLPFDIRIAESSWDGAMRWPRPFMRGVKSMSDVVVESLP